MEKGHVRYPGHGLFAFRAAHFETRRSQAPETVPQTSSVNGCRYRVAKAAIIIGGARVSGSVTDARSDYPRPLRSARSHRRHAPCETSAHAAPDTRSPEFAYA
jgi:hypothetical protein